MFLFFTRIFYASFYTSQNIGVVFSNEDDFEFIKKELKEYNPSVKIMKLGRDYNEIKEVIKKKRADKIIFTSEMVKDFSFVVRLYWYAVKNGISLLLFPSVSEAFIAKIDFSGVNGLPFINIGSKIGIVERFVKRIVDFIISVSVLILFSPFFLIIAFFIKFDTPGPVFYVQERIGKDGKKFKLYKFRTMVKDAEASTGPTLALPDDKRITKVGKILRKYRIDELPQFINVFLGDMSIVGPRPEREVFIKKFYTKLPGYFIRTTVKPGITGLAQIYGGYYTKPEDKLKFDFIYINNYSLFLDFKIMFLTFFQLLFAKGR
jgi:exopolysaccharide biosynthesis polyprenyl glycosylphosphotransferase